MAGDVRPMVSSVPPLPPLVYRGDGRVCPLDNIFRGRTCFLICGGPSLRSIPVGTFEGRGIVSMALNNAWIIHRPTLWLSVDTPSRFSDGGWQDPGILKFIPRVHAKAPIRITQDNKLVVSSLCPVDMPSTFLFQRNNGFDPALYLDEVGVSWGTLRNKKDALGIANSRSVMLASFKLLWWLGFRTIYLVGCDFHMSINPAISPYAWQEKKSNNGRHSNNKLYDILTRRFGALKPYLDERGFQVFNCTYGSRLKVFPYKPLADALNEARAECDRPRPTEGWYT